MIIIIIIIEKYRPISPCSFAWLIFDLVAHISPHLKINYSIDPDQHGFVSDRLTRI